MSQRAESEFSENNQKPLWFDQEDNRERGLAMLLKHKNDKTLSDLARQLILTEEKLQDVERYNLMDFFDSVLSNNPNERGALSGRGSMLGEHKMFEPTISETDFRVRFQKV